jgi:histidinol-phosphate aminotransferase
MNPLESLRPEIRTLQPYTIEETSARIKIDANESPFDPPEEIRNEVLEELERIHVNRYPDPNAAALKKKISGMLEVETGRILLGNGSDELISYLITTFTGENKGVLYPAPTFSMYGILARTQGQPAMEFPMDGHFQFNPKRFIRMIQERSPQIVFLASPNNPTGNMVPAETILDILKESRTLVVVDEAYIDFSGHGGCMQYLKTYPHLIILRTLSKIGMAALRIGILVASREVVRELEKVRLPYNINTLSQAAASVLLRHPETLKEQIQGIVSEREKLFHGMSGIPGLELFPSQANFILFRTAAADGLYKSLLNQGILIRNLNQPGALKECLRVTVGRPDENKAFLEQVKNFFNS